MEEERHYRIENTKKISLEASGSNQGWLSQYQGDPGMPAEHMWFITLLWKLLDNCDIS